VREEISKLIDEMITQQREKVLLCGRQFIPNLTEEDALQPIDYLALEENPYFRYEEGVLAGMLTMRMALLAEYAQESLSSSR
jgi:hypothetical protein